MTTPAQLRRWHRPLMIMVAVMTGLATVAAAGLIIDSRQILGESVWLKPFKFAVSFVLYGLTLAWLFSRLDPGRQVTRRIAWWSATAFCVTGIVDVAFVAIQAARGTFSHFNAGDDAFNQVGQQVFQWGVITLFLANLVLATVLIMQRGNGPAINRAVVFGLVLAVLGMLVAFGLAGGGHEYHVVDAYGRPVELGASHSIGVPPGGPSLPLVGWSITGGDLRVPHFFGMHVIHILLALVLVLALGAARVDRLRPERVRARLVLIAGVFCAGIFVLLSVQAIRGEPVIAPSPAIAAAGLALLLGCVVTAAAVLHIAKRAVPAGSVEPPRAAAASVKE